MRRHLFLAASAAVAATVVSRAHGAEVGYYAQPALHGDRLVFVSEGDLWTTTIPAEGAAAPLIAHRLTASDGSESHPRISPDGLRLAFAGQYDGNTDVYIMPIDGGAPERLTFHPGGDVPLDWAADGRRVLFGSSRAQPLGRTELWNVHIGGGMPERYPFGECSMIALSSTGSRFAFTRWSNERWHWKGYRGGTAPEVWVGDFAADTFAPLTDDRASDLFPMWLIGRVFFISDRDGLSNVYSDRPQGGDLKRHTAFAADPDNPTALEGYDVRWPSEDAQRRGQHIVFCQGGGLALLDVVNGGVRRLDVRIASDRIAARRRFTDLPETLGEYALSPDGKSLLLGSRGEAMLVDVKTGVRAQMTRSSGAREWGFSWLGDDQIVLISDGAEEPQIAVMPADGSEGPSLATEDREVWLFAPIGSRDGRWIAFGDKTMRLHVIDMQTLERRQVDQAEAGEIIDYRFSPDNRWLAYTRPEADGRTTVMLHALLTKRTFAIGSPLSSSREPRWDPAGRFLYFIGDDHLDPVIGRFDYEHVYVRTSRIYVVPLTADGPPPFPVEARAAGFDLEAWATPKKADEADPTADAAAPDPAAVPDRAMPDEAPPLKVDTDGIATRLYAVPVEPGDYRALEAGWGGITYLADPVAGLLDRDRGSGALAPGRSVLHRYDFAEEKATTVAEKVRSYTVSRDRKVVAYPAKGAIVTRTMPPPGKEKKVDLDGARLRVDVRAEWQQVLDEAWRLQRDFYWAPNMVGVDWPAMRAKYEALLPRIGTRAELNDVVGEMIGELGTSHTYIWGGQLHEHDKVDPVSVGLLGADIEFDGMGFRITRVVPGAPWNDDGASPLEPSWLGVQSGNVLMAIDGEPLNPGMNVYELLQDRAKRRVRLTLADEPGGTNRRTIEVNTIPSERELRYLAWVEATRRYVDEASEGRLGYLHIPDMGGTGLALFSRQFLPQFKKQGLVIDVRDNGGGFVSQMIIQRLAREVIAFDEPRHGVTDRYPYRAPHAHMAALINQHAGSDGDIFPHVFRARGLGPLIGTRTWGGVIGIRSDKPFIDLGMSTQPEYAWWDETGWSIENVGVSPDIEVDLTPADRVAGRDPQLDRAIEFLLKKLEEEPMELPEKPAYPVRRR